MSCISFTTIFTSIVLAAMTAVGGLFFAPLIDEIKTAVESFLKPQSCYEDFNKLLQLLKDIKDMDVISEMIHDWIEEANAIIHQVEQEIELSSCNDSHQSGCLCGDACSWCNLHRNIKNLITRGEVFKCLLPRAQETVAPILEVTNSEDRSIAPITVTRFMEVLNDEDVWCIGVCGPGGVGKTTLVKAVHNELKSGSKFDLLRLIELKANDGHDEVQDAIAKSLKLNMGDGIEERIYKTLQRQKFLLVLDNVWRDINLSRIGIPERQAGSKIILTTRFKRICTSAEATKIVMRYLTEEEAWQLFAENAGEVVNDEKISPVAREVCKICAGWPTALVAVGSAMKGKRKIDEWNDVADYLSSIPVDVCIDSAVYYPLKLIYDGLDDTLKSCFLYCSLYPNGCSIGINELVHCWLAENLIDQKLHYTEACSTGLSLINTLKESCLLESGDKLQTVRMNYMVRGVARYIGNTNKKSSVFSGDEIIKSPSVTLSEEFMDFQWISFVENRELILPRYEKDCPSVTTLLIHGRSYEEKLKFSAEYLKSFRAVKVLNIGRAQSFSASHLRLEELHTLIQRDCSDIEEVPTAKNLKIFDLSHSSYLRNIPKRTKEYCNLKVLDLSHTPCLERIDADTVHNLNSLEVLDMSNSGYKWSFKKRSESEEATLQDLSRLQCLREVYLELAEADGTYEGCSWMGRLQRFYISYGCPATQEHEGKIFHISMEEKYTEVIGSFILHAHSLILGYIKNVKEIFAPFSSTDQSKSKLKSVMISNSAFDTSSTAVRKYNVLSRVEELHLKRNKLVSSFSDIAYALGTNFTKLRSLKIEASAAVVFSSNDLHIVLPELQKMSLYGCRKEVAFDCGLADIQAIAPKLRILGLYDSDRLESVCNCESNEKWQSLEILVVKNCYKLKKFPFMRSIKMIRGTAGWFNKVKWASREMKSNMSRHFVEI